MCAFEKALSYAFWSAKEHIWTDGGSIFHIPFLRKILPNQTNLINGGDYYVYAFYFLHQKKKKIPFFKILN